MQARFISSVRLSPFVFQGADTAAAQNLLSRFAQWTEP